MQFDNIFLYRYNVQCYMYISKICITGHEEVFKPLIKKLLAKTYEL